MRRLSVFLMVIGLGIAASAFTVTGTLTDAEGKPMKKVRVGTLYGMKSVKTDKNGKFNIECKDADTLVIIDKKRMVTVPVSEDVDLEMTFGNGMATASCGDDLMMFSYHEPPKRERGSGLTAEIIARRNPKDIWELLDGGLAGVRVENQEVTIRGIHSINCSLEPLFIVDGIEYSSSLAANQALNINEIKYVEVNKDGLGYGIKGANGVIIFHYKTGKD